MPKKFNPNKPAASSEPIPSKIRKVFRDGKFYVIDQHGTTDVSQWTIAGMGIYDDRPNFEGWQEE